MASNILSELIAARQITRQIVEAARDPLSPALASGDARRSSNIPAGTPDVTTGTDSGGQTTFDAMFDVDAFDSQAVFS